MEEATNEAHDDSICGAKTRAGTPCQQRAGWGTNHVGTGRCKLHGGKSTGPKDKEKAKNNKNAVTTGERESIVFDYLDDEEKDLLNQIELDKLKQIDNEIKLIEIRLRRMMGRIAKLQKNDVTTIEIISKTTPVNLDGGTIVSELVEKQQSNLAQIQNIEEAVTRVQRQKLRLIETKHELQQDLGGKEVYEDDGWLDALIGQVDEVWDDEDEG